VNHGGGKWLDFHRTGNATPAFVDADVNSKLSPLVESRMAQLRKTNPRIH
jgi:hypothetical protein